MLSTREALAAVMGMLMGLLVYLLSRAIGLETALGGALLSCAWTTVLTLKYLRE